jgi:hypothetical protein
MILTFYDIEAKKKGNKTKKQLINFNNFRYEIFLHKCNFLPLELN